MTTVAIDGRFMAADTLGDNGGLRMPTSKIFRTEAFVLGGSGPYGHIHRYFRLIKAMSFSDVLDLGYPTYDEDDDNPGMIIAGRGNPGLAYYLCGSEWVRVARKYHAIGSGRDFAMAGMALGKTAAEAVDLAISFDTYSGGTVDWVEI